MLHWHYTKQTNKQTKAVMLLGSMVLKVLSKRINGDIQQNGLAEVKGES